MIIINVYKNSPQTFTENTENTNLEKEIQNQLELWWEDQTQIMVIIQAPEEQAILATIAKQNETRGNVLVTIIRNGEYTTKVCYVTYEYSKKCYHHTHISTLRSL